MKSISRLKTNKCKKCSKEFSYYTGAYRGLNKLYCSRNCYVSARQEKAKKKCPECGKMYFLGKHTSATTVCSRECYSVRRTRLYKEKDHPCYKNGKSVDRGSVACGKYRKKLVTERGYPFCEHCGVNQSIRFEVHHIVFRSEKPRHKNLHDNYNLIHVCIECHNMFHSADGKEARQYLIESRKLRELFEDKTL